MIPNTHPLVATFKRTTQRDDGSTHTYFDYAPIIAWDEDGRPLVAMPGRFGLEPAHDFQDYSGIKEQHPVVAAVPGADYHVEYRQDDDQAKSWPLLAWLIHADGSVMPIDTEGFDPRDALNFTRIFHPSDERPIFTYELPE